MKLQPEHVRLIAWMAQQSGKPEAQVLGEILEEYFEDMRRDADRASRIVGEHNPSISLEDVMRRHGLDHPL